MKAVDTARRDEIIQRQPEAGRAETADIFRTLLASSFRGAFGPARLQYLFSGKPGTGKTTLLEDISQSIGAPLVMLNYEEMEQDDISGNSIHGFAVRASLPGEPPRLSLRGQLRDGVRETGVKNPLIGIDEFSGRDLNAHHWKAPQLKKLLNKDRLQEAEPGEEDLSGVSFFILTNDENIDSAIRSRLTEKVFPALDTKSHAQARDEQIAAFISQYRKENEKSVAPQAERDFIAAVINKTEQEIEKYKDLMVDLNKDPGARTIKKTASQAIDFIFTETFLARDADYEVPSDDVRNLIARYSAAVDGKLTVQEKKQEAPGTGPSNEGEGSGGKKRSMLDV